jgi:hypothetical protein
MASLNKGLGSTTRSGVLSDQHIGWCKPGYLILGMSNSLLSLKAVKEEAFGERRLFGNTIAPEMHISYDLELARPNWRRRLGASIQIMSAPNPADSLATLTVSYGSNL